jgi:N6-adenosine-specific RNA methylase IME4
MQIAPQANPLTAAPGSAHRSAANVWAARITACWRASVEAILEVGKLLAAAKESLPHGDYEAMIENDLPFSASTSRRLKSIAEDPKLSNRAHVHVLPPHWGTLYELTKLDESQFQAKINDGTIHPEMERREIAQTVKTLRRAKRERDLAEKQTALPTKKYGVIVADPEWRFEPWSRETGMDRAADNHYPTSCLDVIKARDVASIAAPDCVLFLWATAPMLPHALVVMAAWGFDYRSHFVWIKDKFGTGYWNRSQHELLLVGVRGKIPAPAMGTQWKSIFPGAVEQHSAKPEAAFLLIERYFPTLPKIELNRRGPPRAGWHAWGNEAGHAVMATAFEPASTTVSSQQSEDLGSSSEFDDPSFLPPLLEWRTPLE